MLTFYMGNLIVRTLPVCKWLTISWKTACWMLVTGLPKMDKLNKDKTEWLIFNGNT